MMLEEHMGHGDPGGWGWCAGVGRDPAAGDQETFGNLIKGWIAAVSLSIAHAES